MIAFAAQLNATRSAFFAAGFAFASWAPVVPFAKARVGAGDGLFGVLILCMGLGAVLAMPLTGWWAARFGARRMILAGWGGLVLVLPVLGVAPSVAVLAVALFGLGAAVGTLDVAMNVYGSELEVQSGRPLMSGLHALFSVGSLVGAALGTALLSLGAVPLVSTGGAGALALALLLWAQGRFVAGTSAAPERFVWPRGVVLGLAVLTGLAFLTEASVLDWGALLLIDRGLALPERAGVGFILFSLAMVAGRLSGDRVVAMLGAQRVLMVSGLGAAAALVLMAVGPGRGLTLAGFALLGLAAANVVPVLFSLAGRQNVMSPGLAIASIALVGYAGGGMLGPAGIGAVAEATSLPLAFIVMAVLTLAVPLSARRVTG